jgi:hypothetical protein
LSDQFEIWSEASGPFNLVVTKRKYVNAVEIGEAIVNVLAVGGDHPVIAVRVSTSVHDVPLLEPTM